MTSCIVVRLRQSDAKRDRRRSPWPPRRRARRRCLARQGRRRRLPHHLRAAATSTTSAAAMASASSRPTACPSRFPATSRAAARATIERWEGIPQQHQPHRAAFARPSGGGAILHRRARLSAVATGSAISCASCAAIDAHHRIAILPGPPCLNHVAYDMLGVDDMMRGIGRLKQTRHRHSLGSGPPHRRRQHLQLFRHAQRLRGGIHRRARGGRFRDARGARCTRPRRGSWTNGASASAARRPCRIPSPIRGLFQPAEA